MPEYPLVYDLNLLSYARSPATGIPASVDIGLELLNDALYRISLGPYILEGGHWPRGFHILTILLRSLFERSDTYEFVLDLKAGDLVVRKPVRVRIEIADLVSAPAAAPKEDFFRETRAPLEAARVEIPGTALAVTTDATGGFSISGIPIGVYAARFSAVGYQPFTQTNLIIGSGKPYTVLVELDRRPLTLETIAVTAAPYFQPTLQAPSLGQARKDFALNP